MGPSNLDCILMLLRKRKQRIFQCHKVLSYDIHGLFQLKRGSCIDNIIRCGSQVNGFSCLPAFGCHGLDNCHDIVFDLGLDGIDLLHLHGFEIGIGPYYLGILLGNISKLRMGLGQGGLYLQELCELVGLREYDLHFVSTIAVFKGTYRTVKV